MRLVLFLASLAAALGLAVIASQTPAPLAASAPAIGFSAERAMVDVRRIARAPHPVGSAEHQQVQAYLVQRLAALGLQPGLQSGALSPAAARRIEKDGGDAGALRAVNIVGVLPGRDPNLPAVARLMRRGVKWVVPKPDAVKSGLTDADLYPGVEVGPMSDFLFINLEAQGYVFTGTKSLDGP